MQIDGNQILNEQPKLNDKSNINRVITEPINMDMNETDLVKYLAKIPSADPNCPSIAKTIKYDYDDVDNNGPISNNDDINNNNNKSNKKNPSINTRLRYIQNIGDEDERNRILIARLLAELSYEKNKNKMALKSTMDTVDDDDDDDDQNNNNQWFTE
ncbi:hypothetical protein HUG17_9267 [Dermatophagoides farinae]|uniref:Uncharacterized protein n=1 Tax=Dermatophagoides farinae TaxID=6954 RepID=A0A9D4NU49_DERFA|nr:hypothetical protein HUG17_9267 [Dermatophagoides farinae]